MTDMYVTDSLICNIVSFLSPVKNLTELMTDMQLGSFLELIEQAGINITMGKGNVTLFAPTNQAMKGIVAVLSDAVLF